MSRQSVFARTVVALAVNLAAAGCTRCQAADEPENHLAQFYGFGRLELYKLQQRSANMLAADLNNDGKTDLILIDNSNSRLDLLQQRTKPEAAGKPVGPGKINAIENDKRFEHK